MSKTFLCVFVCVLYVVGTASSSYIKSFVDMYRTMAPLASLPPLTIKGLTEEERHSLDSGLMFASGLSGMGSELLVTGANNASEVAHHGLQSALHFAERAILEGSKLATQGLDILNEIETKAPHYAGTVRNVVPLVGSRSLSDVRADVSSFHSEFLPGLNQVVGNSHVIVDKVSQFFQKIVNVVNDIIQIAISLAKMAITGDIGEIEKYEKDLMLRTTGTTDPGGTDISEAVIGSILSNAGKYTAAEYWNPSGGGSVTGGSEEVSTKEQADGAGNSEVGGAGTVEGNNVESAADGLELEDGLKQKAPIVVVGETVNSTESFVGNSNRTLGSDTNLQDRILISNETFINVTDAINTTEGENILAGNSSVDNVQEDGTKPETRQVPHQEEIQAGSDREESNSVSSVVKPDESWSFFGMVVNAVKNTASSIKHAVIGGPATVTQEIPGGEKNTSGTASAMDSSNLISGEHGLGEGDDPSTVTNSTVPVEASSALGQAVGPEEQVNTSTTALEKAATPSNDVGMTGLENKEDLMNHSNTGEEISEISKDPLAVNASTGTRDHDELGAVEPTETSSNTAGSVGSELPDSSGHGTPGEEIHSPDKNPGARGLEGVSKTMPSELNTSPSVVDKIPTVSSENPVTESLVGPENSTGSPETVTNRDPSTLNENKVVEDELSGAQTNENSIIEEKTAVQEIYEGAEPNNAVHLAEESKSGAGSLNATNAERTNDTNSKEVITNNPESSSGFFGRFVKFVGKVANNAAKAVADTVAPGSAKLEENLAQNVSKAVIESVTRGARGPSRDVTTGDHTSDISSTTSTSSVIPTIAKNIPPTLNEELNTPQITITREGQQTETGVDQQLVKPGNVDEVKPGFANDAPAGIISGARGLFDEETDYTDHFSTASSGDSNDIPSVSDVMIQKNDQHVTTPEEAAKVETNKKQPDDKQPASGNSEDVLQGSSVAVALQAAAASAPKPSSDSAFENNEVLNSPESIISGAHGLDIEYSPTSHNNADTATISSRPSAQEPSRTPGVGENEKLNSPQSITSGAHVEDAQTSADAHTGISPSASFTSPEPIALQGVVKNEALDSPGSTTSGARGLEDVADSTVTTNIMPLKTPGTSNGIDLFGKIVKFVGKAASNAATAVVETVAPESVKFVENLANNVTKAVIESVAPEGKTFVENLAQAMVEGVSAGGNLTPGPASIPSDAAVSGAGGLDVEDIPKGADSDTIPTVSIASGAAVPSANEATSLQALFSTSQKSQILPQSEDQNPKTNGSTSHPSDGGWIFVNVVNSKPQLFYAPEGTIATVKLGPTARGRLPRGELSLWDVLYGGGMT